MTVGTQSAPIIIKRIKKSTGGGHHGGAWKVAYADFVTAMMAFFMLMWLLNATTEKQRKGLADYFNPTIPINRISGGGDGAFGGKSMFSQEMAPQSGTGGLSVDVTIAQNLTGTLQKIDPLKAVEEKLLGSGAESLVMENALRHVITRLTDRGLVIEMFDLPGAPLVTGVDTPSHVLNLLVDLVSQSLQIVENPAAIEAHVASFPEVLRVNPSWQVSQARVTMLRNLFDSHQFDPKRIRRVTAHADRSLATQNPMEERNNRFEIVVLRTPIE